MPDWRAWVALARVGNVSLGAVGVVVGALAAVPWDRAPWLAVGLAAGAAAFGTAAGNALNDVRDRTVDARAHPERPLPSGRIRPGAAFEFALVAFGTGLVLAWFAHPAVFALAAANVGLLALYERRAKAAGLAGNLVVAWLVASLFLVGGVAALQPASARDLAPLAAPLLLAALAFAANAARELVKDCQDVDGDRGARVTVPMRLGVVRARRLAAVVGGAGVAVSPLPGVLGLGFGPWFWVALVPADVLLVRGLAARDPRRASGLLKLGMAVALVAFAAARL